MKYIKPNLEVIWLETRDVFMTASSPIGGTGSGEGGGFNDDKENGDGF